MHFLTTLAVDVKDSLVFLCQPFRHEFRSTHVADLACFQADDDGIVVLRSGKADEMEATTVPVALAERLGPAATLGLVELFNSSEDSCVEHVMTQSAERFERRLVEEVSKLRIEMAQGTMALRQDMATMQKDLRQEMADLRFDLLKWSFLFWIGQVVAVATLLRLTGR